MLYVYFCLRWLCKIVDDGPTSNDALVMVRFAQNMKHSDFRHSGSLFQFSWSASLASVVCLLTSLEIDEAGSLLTAPINQLISQNGRFRCKVVLHLKNVCYKVALCEYRQRQCCKAPSSARQPRKSFKLKAPVTLIRANIKSQDFCEYLRTQNKCRISYTICHCFAFVRSIVAGYRCATNFDWLHDQSWPVITRSDGTSRIRSCD